VEAADPLVEAFNYAALYSDAPDHFMLDPFAEIVKAVWYINKARSLIEKGIVVLRPHAATEQRRIAAGFVDDFIADETRHSELSTVLGTSDDEVWSAYSSDFIHCMQQISGSHADFWFPSRKHQGFARIVTSSALSELVSSRQLFAELNEIALPDIADLTVADLVSIRADSGALSRWRDCLATCFEELERQRALGVDEELARAAASDVLLATAVEVAGEFGRDISAVWKGATKALIVGTGATVPAFVAGQGSLYSLAGAGVGFVINLIWGRTEGRGRRAAIRSLDRHVLALSESLTALP